MNTMLIHSESIAYGDSNAVLEINFSNIILYLKVLKGDKYGCSGHGKLLVSEILKNKKIHYL